MDAIGLLRYYRELFTRKHLVSTILCIGITLVGLFTIELPFLFGYLGSIILCMGTIGCISLFIRPLLAFLIFPMISWLLKKTVEILDDYAEHWKQLK